MTWNPETLAARTSPGRLLHRMLASERGARLTERRPPRVTPSAFKVTIGLFMEVINTARQPSWSYH